MESKLALTEFEEFLFWEDVPSYPCGCFLRLRFSGRIDRRAYEAAVARTIDRHPLLRSRVQRRGRRWVWEVDQDALPETRWIVGPTGGPFPPAEHLNPREEIGLVLHVVAGDQATDVTVQWQHVACDGAGALAFINDLLVAYALESADAPDGLKLPELDLRRLERRGHYGLSAGRFLKMLPRQLVGLKGARQFAMRAPAPLTPYQPSPGDQPLPPSYPATCTQTFAEEEVAALRRIAKGEGVTLNDLLTRDLFLALAEWRRRRGVENEAWLRLMVPMNLRTSGDRRLPAANVVSSIFLDRRGDDFDDPRTLLAGIHDELNLIKENNLGLTFILSLRLLRFLGQLKSTARKDACTVSCIFTNLGKVLARCPLPRRGGRIRTGGLELIDIDGIAPLRPYNCATFAAILYAGGLNITLHYDARTVDAGQAAELIALLLDRLRQTAGRDETPRSE